MVKAILNFCIPVVRMENYYASARRAKLFPSTSSFVDIPVRTIFALVTIFEALLPQSTTPLPNLASSNRNRGAQRVLLKLNIQQKGRGMQP